MPFPANLPLSDAQKAFDNLNEIGTVVTLRGGPHHASLSESHLQGIAQYFDPQGRRYYLITQNRHDHTDGSIYLFSDTEYIGAVLLHVDLGATESAHDRFNHPGGLQCVGDYFVVPVQTQDYKSTYIQLYSISAPTGQPPAISLAVNDYIPEWRHLGIGSIGVGAAKDTLCVAGLDGSTLLFFASTSGDITRPEFAPAGSYEIPSEITFFESVVKLAPQFVQIVTDTDDNLYVVIHTVINDASLSYTDLAFLFSLDFETTSDGSMTPTLKLLKERHFVCEGTSGAAGISFRFAVGVSVVPGSHLQLLATARVMGRTCEIDKFYRMPDPPAKPEGLITRWLVYPGRDAKRDDRAVDLLEGQKAKVVVYLPEMAREEFRFTLKRERKDHDDSSITERIGNGSSVTADSDWSDFGDRIYLGDRGGSDEPAWNSCPAFYVDLVRVDG